MNPADIFDFDLDEENLRRAYESFRAERGLLGPKEVKEIRQELGLTQRGLAKLLAWSPATVNRYEKSGVASPAHNDVLRMLKSSDYVPQLLRERADELPPGRQDHLYKAGPSVGRDLAEAVRSILEAQAPSADSGYRSIELDRLAQMAAFFTGGSGVPVSKLMGLIWYADFVHFREQTVGISGGLYLKKDSGPCLRYWPFILGVMSQEGHIEVEERIRARALPDLSVFSRSEVTIMDRVRNRLGHLNAGRLSERCRRERGWVETADGEIISYHHAARLDL